MATSCAPWRRLPEQGVGDVFDLGRFFTVKLPVALDPGSKISVVVETVYTHVLHPYPTQITQSEKQFVVFEGNHYFYSPYPTKTQTTRVKLASRNVESYTKLGSPARSEDLLDYGPFKDVPAYSQDTFCVLQTILPAAAQDVYYRDEIGNVSTSHLLILDDSVEMEIRPRFPLFGGWKTHYIVGYNLPSYEYLYNLGQSSKVRGKRTFSLISYSCILFPPRSRNIQIDSPYDISRAPDELHYTYLDTFGRPVIVAYKTNLVEQHIQDIVVHYTFNKVLMLQEPLLVVAAFYILFFTVIVYVRLDFSITKDPAAEARMKVACITEQVLTLVNKRIGLYRHFDEAVNRYKQSRDVSALNSGKKGLETEHKALTSEIALLQSRLKTEGSDLCDRVSDIQKLDAQVKELVLKSAVEAERLVAGKLKKDTYIENEKLLSGKRQELVTKLDHILDAL
ncbi:PREDICTED: dolichyl-diphosphooligosaccharide--protein glycosyltransferase subunit 1 [Propithecus coquereli]|uniref:dolichyl-diphosphooligosaccharide--protein glycosyltransferase subunit 1 n=1 Tax=Propithecus coquereli TaxID=379532 RepID=UPI00063F7E2E|nr:PREDICTED: dolichyl-diphosphooligosaccharide--protein glycosyltransferase subunit 1 [Propithecus coquereli]